MYDYLTDPVDEAPLFLFRANLMQNVNERVGVGACGRLVKDNGVEECMMSFAFYPTPQTQLAAVFDAILRRLPFVVGNKQTAVLWLLTIAPMYGLTVASEDVLVDCVLQVISNTSKGVEHLAEQLFVVEV